ncbi:class I SAM-dependent methyltransferase [Pseudomonas sp. R3.Fl]|uniref:class I SAM-dependent methyltransferase n=1 Tax=Pseudomonas TaxID=286 RepID=UPI00201E0B48|nr:MULTISPECIES: class I SAM-dependent methyltransferase [Pseudomonas]MCL6690045.1 class I SAM-dependent methyltransferase [Pseudomonas sp. R3.Fl]MCP1641355.1 SAM-dependent methyltransferase [Pseudomonas citronellolis]MCP1664273.1 SAM-dependent methyltransferase [Pseudomonas citronellolis]MCP1695247.1 SAM-dependent methyltransferase [Pseudomonas citronellolis]MCP1702108.1 SAM-dependent methyltransferase [Pseudomonas citronellolis]
MDLKETDILGEHIADHWYYRSKRAAVQQFLGDIRPSSILDVGAGSGFFSRALLAEGSAGEAWCVDISYPADSDASEAGKPIRFRRSVDRLDSDLVLLMDVLEHVDDDVGLLRHYVEKVPHGAHFLISVPAFQFLWSDHDVFLEHKRRYRLTDIERVAEQAGLEVLKGAYYFGGVFPIAATLRLLERLRGGAARQPRSQLKRHNGVVNAALQAVSMAELPVLRFNRVAGLTAFCLARRP